MLRVVLFFLLFMSLCFVPCTGYCIEFEGEEVSESFDLPYGTVLKLGALVNNNINNNVVGIDEDENPYNSFSNAKYSMSLSIPIWKAICVEPKMSYTRGLDEETLTGFDAFNFEPGYETDTDLYGGFAISISF